MSRNRITSRSSCRGQAQANEGGRRRGEPAPSTAAGRDRGARRCIAGRAAAGGRPRASRRGPGAGLRWLQARKAGRRPGGATTGAHRGPLPLLGGRSGASGPHLAVEAVLPGGRQQRLHGGLQECELRRHGCGLGARPGGQQSILALQQGRRGRQGAVQDGGSKRWALAAPPGPPRPPSHLQTEEQGVWGRAQGRRSASGHGARSQPKHTRWADFSSGNEHRGGAWRCGRSAGRRRSIN